MPIPMHWSFAAPLPRIQVETPVAAFRYRQALCHEGRSEWKEASELYAELNVEGFSAQTIAAQLGQVRCWLGLHREYDPRRQLCQLILNSAHPAMRGKPFLGEAYHLRANLEMMILPQLPPVHPAYSNGLADLPNRTDLTRYIIGPTGRLCPKPGQNLLIALKLTERNPSRDQQLVTVHRNAIVLKELLRQVAEKAGLFLWAIPDLESSLGSQIVTVHVDHQPIADLFRLAWNLREWTGSLRTAKSLSHRHRQGIGTKTC